MYIIFCTCSNLKSARTIATTLVKEKLAACVNLLNVKESIYEWKGKIVKDPEVLLIIKSPKKNFSKLKKRIKQLHPYSVPEIVALEPSKVNKKYKEWVLSIS